MNNLSSYFGLVDSKIRASDKDLPVKVTPESLYIEGPYDKQKWTRFALINEQPKNQVFKIKSTRPESISVSPNRQT